MQKVFRPLFRLETLFGIPLLSILVTTDDTTKSVSFDPGGVHKMLRVRVCTAHMGGFLGPKFSKQGSLLTADFP